MKKMTSEKLMKIKENFDILMEKKIREAEDRNAIASIGKMGFNDLKNVFESITKRLYENDSTKHYIKDYIKTINSSDGLMLLYRMNEGIRKRNFGENVDAKLFVESSVEMFKKTDKKRLNESMNKLQKLIESSAKEVGMNRDEVYDAINNEYVSLNESLDYIVNHEKTSKNLYDYLENVNKIVSFMNENKKTVESNINDVEASEDNLNSTINESMESFEKEAISRISLAELEGKSNSDLFEESKKECLDILNESIEDEEESEGKARFETMKLQLESKVYNDDTFIDDILKMTELKHTLR